MDEEFEYLINFVFNHSKACIIDITSNEWQRCDQIIKEIINDSDTFFLLQEYYIENYRRFLTLFFKDYWVDFEANVQIYKDNSYSQHRYMFYKIEQLYLHVTNWIKNPLLDSMFNCLAQLNEFTERLHQILYTALLADMPLVFSSFLFNTFTFSFEVLDSIINKDETQKPKLFECSVCKYKRTQIDALCFCESLSKGFIPFLGILRKLGIFHQLCDDIIKTVLYNTIEKHISNLCKEKNFDISCLTLTCTWFKNNVIVWIRIIYFVPSDKYNDMAGAISYRIELIDDSMNEDKEHSSEMNFHLNFQNFGHKLLSKIENLNLHNIGNFLTNTYIYCRMKQLFDIIIDYPYSEPALLDLHECVKIEPFYREKFTQSLKVALEMRLLHAGVPTGDIIEAYITTIKALKLLDPQGIILQIVCDPVRNYLRTREDTVRCIITFLTNDSLVNLENSRSNNLKDILNEDEVIFETWKSWVPQTIGVSRINKDLINSDIISMLINIFDSKDLFVQEYQRLLAQKIILNSEINLEFELRNLEILSLRFGESDLHNCEVMLKDLKDSERINNRVNSDEFEIFKNKNYKLNGLVLSQQFWPENLGFTNNECKNFKLPDEMNEAFESYKKAFETLKVNRTLTWIHQLGTVKLEIEFKNGAQEYSVRPIQAAIIYLFQKKNIWKISDLVKELDVLPSVVLRNISYWKNIGVLKESSEDECYEIVEDGPSFFSKHNSNGQSSLNNHEFDMFIVEEEVQTDEKQKNDNNLQIFWNFIDNMLKNLHALSLDRIYSMLKMFYMQSPEIENLSMNELRQFLDHKVFERKLVFTNGLYDLNPQSD